MEYRIPKPLKAEHEELHEELARATKAGGNIGKAAKAVAEIMHSHFEKEEEYAMPPLGLLIPLSKGEITPEMGGVLRMTDRLKRDFPEMLSEHEALVAALEKLSEAAKEEDKPEYAHFAEKLILHARTEEDVFYPASILIGEYLKLKLGTGK